MKIKRIVAVLLHIPQNYKEGMSDDEVYEAARGTWGLSEHRQKEVKYALAVVNKTVVGVYRIKQWNKSRDGKWAFERQDTEDTIQKGYKGYKIEDIDDLEMGRSPFCYVQLVCEMQLEQAQT